MFRTLPMMVIMLCVLPVRATAQEAHGDLVELCREYIAVDDYKEQRRILPLLQKAHRIHGHETFQRALETAVGNRTLPKDANRRYLNQASRLGVSDLFWRTALATIQNKASISSALRGLGSYLAKHPEAHKKHWPDLNRALWKQMERSPNPNLSAIFRLLSRTDQEKVRTYIPKRLAEEGLKDQERMVLSQTYFFIKTVPEKERADLLKSELAKTDSSTNAHILQILLRRLVGDTEARKAAGGKTIPEKYRDKSQDKLRKATVTFEFIETPIKDGLDIFQNRFGLQFVVSPEVKPVVDGRATATLYVHDVTMMNALHRVLLSAGLSPKVIRGQLHIVKGVARDTTTFDQKNKLRTLLAKKISFEWKDIAGIEAINFLRSLSGLQFTFAPSVRKTLFKHKLPAENTNLPVSTVLRKILSPAHLRYRFLHGSIYIYK